MYRTNVVRQNGPLPFPQSHPLQSWRRGLKRYCLASLCPDDTSLDEEQESIPPQPFHPISSPDVAEPAGGYMSSATSGIESPLLNLPFLRFYDHNGNFKGENKCARIQNILLKDSPEFPFVELGVSHFHFCMFGRGSFLVCSRHFSPNGFSVRCCPLRPCEDPSRIRTASEVCDPPDDAPPNPSFPPLQMWHHFASMRECESAVRDRPGRMSCHRSGELLGTGAPRCCWLDVQTSSRS